ncbi:MAG TPA: hypothetical protein VEY71_08780 [Chitinophagales bacterium]|nr:hypothetical protein [Chitinophagales bacterium]
MNRITRFRFIALLLLLAVASLQSGCSLFKKCGGCPSFSQIETPNSANASATAQLRDNATDAL